MMTPISQRRFFLGKRQNSLLLLIMCDAFASVHFPNGRQVTAVRMPLVPQASKPLPKTKHITLEYPPYWTINMPPFDSHYSMFAKTAASHAIQWLYHQHILEKDNAEKANWERRIKQMNVASYGGSSCLLGNFQHSLLHTKFVLLWLIWDDVVVERVETSPELKDLINQHLRQVTSIMYGTFTPSHACSSSAISGGVSPHRPKTTGNPVLRPFPNIGDAGTIFWQHTLMPFANAWQSIMQDILRLFDFSTTFHVRLGKTFDDWVLAAKQERDNAGAHIRLTFQELVEQRKRTIGLKTTLITLELWMGMEIPPHIAHSVDFIHFCDIATELVGLVNDLVSLGKDIIHFEQEEETKSHASDNGVNTNNQKDAETKEHMWPNIVLAYMTENRICLTYAIAYIVQHHDLLVAQMDALSLQILSNCGEEWWECLSGYFCHVRYCVRGFNLWHTVTPRYTQHAPLDLITNTLFVFSSPTANG